MARSTVVIGLLGPTLDQGRGPSRWEKWRPSVALCQHEDLIVSRFEVLHQPTFQKLYNQIAEDVKSVSPQTTVTPHLIDFENPWDFETVFAALLDFARNYRFNPDEEDYLVHITTGTHVAQICLFLLTEARYLPARLLQTAPPSKWGSGPGTFDVIDLNLSRYDRLASRFAQEQRESASILKSGIETRNAAFNRLIDRVENVAVASRAPILLTGPTGAGKSQLARRIYELKKARRQIEGALVEVNCATLRGDGAMSALFGHRRGSFTGALSDRPGLLRGADGGLLFLDEIAELGPDEQAMLLRSVEDKRFLPVGSDKEVHSDFQLIAGTNRDLKRAVANGSFREDLLARINLWTFELPPLRDRREDIEPNLKYELDQFAARNGTRVTFNKEASARFLDFATGPAGAWLANFRDLNAAVTRMGTLAAGGRISVQLVDEEIERLSAQWAGGADGAPSLDVLSAHLSEEAIAQIDSFDRVQLAEVMRVCAEARSLSEAGRALFDVSRTKKETANDADRLRKYLARFNLDWRRLAAQR